MGKLAPLDLRIIFVQLGTRKEEGAKDLMDGFWKLLLEGTIFSKFECGILSSEEIFGTLYDFLEGIRAELPVRWRLPRGF